MQVAASTTYCTGRPSPIPIGMDPYSITKALATRPQAAAGESPSTYALLSGRMRARRAHHPIAPKAGRSVVKTAAGSISSGEFQPGRG